MTVHAEGCKWVVGPDHKCSCRLTEEGQVTTTPWTFPEPTMHGYYRKHGYESCPDCGEWIDPRPTRQSYDHAPGAFACVCGLMGCDQKALHARAAERAKRASQSEEAT
jgi:hypothetical protein